MKKEINMTSGNFMKNIIIFTIPVILSSVLQLLYNAVDLAVVGQFCGSQSIAAVGSTGSLTALIINIFMGVSIGANVAVARGIGQNDANKVQKLVHTAITFSVIAGAFLMVFGIFTARYWLEIMGTTSDVIDLATIYLQIYFSGMIFNMLYNFGAAVLRAIGETKKPLYFLGIAGLANVGLNLFLVLVFHMDVAGVAIGTIVSQAISAIMIVICLMRKTDMVHLDLKKLRIHGRALGEMILIGLPAGIQGSLFSISNVFIQSAVNSFDSSIIVAGNTAANNIEGFIYVAMNAFHQACITFTSQNYGAGKLKNCKKVLIYSLGYVLITGLLFGGVAILFSRQLLSIYDKNPDVIDVGVRRMTIICLTYFLCGIMDVLVGGLRGLGFSIVPMIVSILGVCGFRLLWIFTVFENNHTLETLYISYPISWIATAFIQLLCYIFVYKYLSKNRPDLTKNERMN